MNNYLREVHLQPYPTKKRTVQCEISGWGEYFFFKDDTGYPSLSMLETKILLNSIISDAQPGDIFMSRDLK